jgi:hypothetical protein
VVPLVTRERRSPASLRGFGTSREQGRQDLNLQPPVLETS